MTTPKRTGERIDASVEQEGTAAGTLARDSSRVMISAKVREARKEGQVINYSQLYTYLQITTGSIVLQIGFWRRGGILWVMRALVHVHASHPLSLPTFIPTTDLHVRYKITVPLEYFANQVLQKLLSWI